MCVRVRFVSVFGIAPWNPGACLITVPDAIPLELRVTAVRGVLAELGVEQPEFGAVCYCGQPVDLLPRVPQQWRSGQVIHHGA